MIQKHLINSYYVINSLGKKHDFDEVRDLVNHAEHHVVVSDDKNKHPIARLDWNFNQTSRAWADKFVDIIHPEVKDMVESIGYNDYTIDEIWFQQYYKDNGHSWHTHSRNFSFVFYLDYDDKMPATNLIDPHTNETIVPNIKQYDLLMFPSYVKHCAPKLEVDSIRTIISFNVTVGVNKTK